MRSNYLGNGIKWCLLLLAVNFEKHCFINLLYLGFLKSRMGNQFSILVRFHVIDLKLLKVMKTEQHGRLYHCIVGIANEYRPCSFAYCAMGYQLARLSVNRRIIMVDAMNLLTDFKQQVSSYSTMITFIELKCGLWWWSCFWITFRDASDDPADKIS